VAFSIPPGFAYPRERWAELRNRFAVYGQVRRRKTASTGVAIAAPQNVAKVEADFREELDKVLKDGFTQKEMDADRSGWLQSQQVNRAEDASLVQILATRDLDDRKMNIR